MVTYSREDKCGNSGHKEKKDKGHRQGHKSLEVSREKTEQTKKIDKIPDLNLSELNVNHCGTTITGPHSVSKKPS